MAKSFVMESGPKDGFLPLCVPEIRGNEAKYVQECIETGWVSSVGTYVDRFERAVADSVGAQFGVATVNGTAALHIALKVAGIEGGDEVLVSTLTFIAPANTIRYVGAYPVFIDCEPAYWQMDPQRVEDFLKRGCQYRDGKLYNRATHRRVKAIMPVHILGHPVDLDPILEIAQGYDLVVLEDATEGLGSSYRSRKVGNLADIGCFSFNGNKIITTGGGGMLVTNNESWARKAKYLTTQAKDDPLEYIHGEVGYNYRLTNLLAAMGCGQMEQLPDYVAAKRRIAAMYSAALDGVPGVTPMAEAPWAQSTYWLYTILVDESRFGMDSRALLRQLDRAKIQTRPLWQPMHRSRVFDDCGTFDCPVADRLNAEALSLPCSVGISEHDIQYVLNQITASRKAYA